MDLSETLLCRSNDIIEQWVSSVFQDQQIEVTQELTFREVRDSMPRVLEALATVLSQSETSDLQTLVGASLEHGTIRAEQGFEPAEIAREYRLLRAVIFSTLEADLLQVPATELLRAVRLIDMVIDEAIARCFNSYTQGRMQELQQLQSQLNLTNQELTRLVRASRDNLAHLAHELKTPLTSIIGYADLFLRQQSRYKQDVRDSATNLESIEQVLRSGRLLLRLINDALEISRYDAGKMKLQPVATDVRQVLRSVLEMMEPLALSKNLVLSLDVDRAPDEVIIDPLRLQQVLTNLFSNAIRYSDAGAIQLKCWQLSSKQWAVSVTDEGAGIPSDVQNHIFDPYFRADAVASKTDGTGLGLAIVARLVKLMQGNISVTSQPGQGSTFTVVLPCVLLPPSNA
ncbi:MAG TPA: sensor histidine kinase [Allocoleopsis sp.]